MHPYDLDPLDPVADVAETVGAWPGVVVEPHPDGGQRFRIAARELGRLHGGGFLDLHFPRRMRDVLVADDWATPHDLFPDSGWLTHRVTVYPNVARAVALLRLSYLYNAALLARAGTVDLLDGVDFDAEFEALDPSPALRRCFDCVRPRT